MVRSFLSGASISAAVLLGAVILYLAGPFDGVPGMQQAEGLFLDAHHFSRAIESGEQILLFADSFMGVPLSTVYDLAWPGKAVDEEQSRHYITALIDPARYPLLTRALGCDKSPSLIELDGNGKILSANPLLKGSDHPGIPDIRTIPLVLSSAATLVGDCDTGLDLGRGDLCMRISQSERLLDSVRLESASVVTNSAVLVPVWLLHASLVIPDNTNDGRFDTFARRYLGAARSHSDESGFHVGFSSSRWENPLPIKTLESNAILLSAVSTALMATSDQTYARDVESISGFISGVLYDSRVSAFAFAEYAPQAQSHLEKTLKLEGPVHEIAAALRKERDICGVFAAYPNALAVSALVSAYQATADGRHLDLAERVFDAFTMRSYNPETGFSRTLRRDGTRRYLIDQVSFMAASVDLFEATGDKKYLQFAEQLLELVQSSYVQAGGLPLPVIWEDAPSNLPVPEYDIEALSLYAVSVERLSHITGKKRLHQVSSGILAGMMELQTDSLADVAVYALAVRHATRYPLSMYVIGDRTDGRTLDLLRAVGGVFAPERVIGLLDPEDDAALIDELGLAYLGEPSVFACVGDMCSLPITRPEDVQNIRNMFEFSLQ